MNPTLALMQREWLQYRYVWLLLFLVPVALAVLVLGVSDVDVKTDGDLPPPLALAAGTLAVTLIVMAALASVSGLVTVIGLARRDHADRSVEYWLSLPIGHTRSLLVPMLVHLVLVPLAAFLAALVVGFLLSLLLVSRVHGPAAWLAAPAGDVLASVAVAVVRVGAGWPMAVLWLSPLVLLAMLMFAWLRRWGLVILGLALAVGSSGLGELLGYRMVPEALSAMLNGAARSIISGRHSSPMPSEADEAVRFSMQQAPAWLFEDIWGSVLNLASPAFVGGLMVSAVCFYGLVQWRKRGASTAV